MSILSKSYFHIEEDAYKFVEGKLWPHGPACPKCKEYKRVSKMRGKSTRIGTYKCYVCRKPFTVKVGTIFESSHIKMNLWLQAIYLMVTSKKGISSNQLHRTLGITLKSAWFMSHRIREAMRADKINLFGKTGGTIEADETLISNALERHSGECGYAHKNKVLSLIDRDSGRSQSMVMDNLKYTTIMPLLKANIAKEAKIMADEAKHYRTVNKHFAEHGSVVHSAGEYVNADNGDIHVNNTKGYFSFFNRGMKGVYQHCGTNHLHRYLAEYGVRYNNRKANGIEDEERADILLTGVVGNRLTYRQSSQ